MDIETGEEILKLKQTLTNQHLYVIQSYNMTNDYSLDSLLKPLNGTCLCFPFFSLSVQDLKYSILHLQLRDLNILRRRNRKSLVQILAELRRQINGKTTVVTVCECKHVQPSAPCSESSTKLHQV